MGQRRDSHLKGQSRNAAENFIHIQDFFRNRFGIANQESPRGSAQCVKLRSGCWPPAAFFANLRERVCVSWEKVVRGLFRRIPQKPNHVEANSELFG